MYILDGHNLCFLCEAPVDVKFEPCGHALMCHDCAKRAKKCPTCKVRMVAYIFCLLQVKNCIFAFAKTTIYNNYLITF